jgi:cyclophilin family peptidyl-prolyl cis-trans isomerase
MPQKRDNVWWTSESAGLDERPVAMVTHSRACLRACIALLVGSAIAACGRAQNPRGSVSKETPSVPSDTELELAYRNIDGNAGASDPSPVLRERLLVFKDRLSAARKARPDDPTVQALTGELLMSVGGESSDILAYLTRAVDAGVRTPRVLAKLATVQGDVNDFPAAYRTALAAVESNPEVRDTWEVFANVAEAIEHFDEVLRRLDATFASGMPPWAETIRARTQSNSYKWKQERNRRAIDAGRNDSARVRFTVAHQAFDVAPNGVQLSSSHVTGTGEVVFELFEDAAPKTVANFIRLVNAKFYDGTKFHAVEHHLVVGGDPNTRNNDPSDDGAGGPGYVIPGESDMPAARGHFAGTLSMVETGPRTAGSQFVICLVSCLELDGHMTAFGRVVSGSDVLNRMAQGRTNVAQGAPQTTIPGDVLVHARIVRRRPHFSQSAPAPSSEREEH